MLAGAGHPPALKWRAHTYWRMTRPSAGGACEPALMLIPHPAQRTRPASSDGRLAWRRGISRGDWARCQVTGSVSGGCAPSRTCVAQRTSPR